MIPKTEYLQGFLSPKDARIKSNIDTAVNTVRGIPAAAGQMAQHIATGLGKFASGGQSLGNQHAPSFHMNNFMKTTNSR